MIMLSTVMAIAFGVLVRQELVGSTKFGAISGTALWLAEIPMQLKRMSELQHDSHIFHHNRFPDQSGFEGTGNDYESYMLLSRFDGDLNQGIVELIDLQNFETLHIWNPDIDAFNKAIPAVNEFKRLSIDNADHRSYMMHPLLTHGGALIFQRVSPLIKIDKCSNLIFQNSTDLFHHSLEEDADGNFWGSTHLYPQSFPEEKVGRDTPSDGGFLDDAIVKVSPTGEILEQMSISRIMIKHGMENQLYMIEERGLKNDPIHVNDVQPVNSDSQFWRKGDLFISLAHQGMVFLYRPSTEEIVWKTSENLFQQHDVNILDDHRISIFNNNHVYLYDGTNVVEGTNELMIYDFLTKNSYPYLNEAFIREDIRTVTQGRGEILANGDVFIEETDYSRTLMLDENGNVKWSHVNRASDGRVYRVGWSRLLYTQRDLGLVRELLQEDHCENKN